MEDIKLFHFEKKIQIYIFNCYFLNRAFIFYFLFFVEINGYNLKKNVKVILINIKKTGESSWILKVVVLFIYLFLLNNVWEAVIWKRVNFIHIT